MITGNKGEWSEIYALFKLLGDRKLLLGDKDIEKLEGMTKRFIMQKKLSIIAFRY